MAERLDEQELHALLEYDPETGVFRWLARVRGYFASDRSWNSWNAKHVGAVAGYIMGGGYRVIAVLGVQQLASRLAWLYVRGVWPLGQIDHINGQRDDNRIANLRDVPQLDNMHNKCIYSNNTSGAVGVEFYAPTKRWRATIRVNGKRKALGHFIDKAEAIAVRKKAETDFGFHQNHGRAA